MMTMDQRRVDELAKMMLRGIRDFMIEGGGNRAEVMNALALVTASMLSIDPDRTPAREFFNNIVTQQLFIFDQNAEHESKPPQ